MWMASDGATSDAYHSSLNTHPLISQHRIVILQKNHLEGKTLEYPCFCMWGRKPYICKDHFLTLSLHPTPFSLFPYPSSSSCPSPTSPSLSHPPFLTIPFSLFPGRPLAASTFYISSVQRSAAHISVIMEAGVNATFQSGRLSLSEVQLWTDEIFFCSHGQATLSKIPWLLIDSDNYYIPSLFLIPEFIPELARLFPTQHVFLHLGRYLLRPSNPAWERITRLHATHYSAAHSKVGIQVR